MSLVPFALEESVQISRKSAVFRIELERRQGVAHVVKSFVLAGLLSFDLGGLGGPIIDVSHIDLWSEWKSVNSLLRAANLDGSSLLALTLRGGSRGFVEIVQLSISRETAVRGFVVVGDGRSGLLAFRGTLLRGGSSGRFVIFPFICSEGFGLGPASSSRGGGVPVQFEQLTTGTVVDGSRRVFSLVPAFQGKKLVIDLQGMR